MSTFSIITGDALATLSTLPAHHVQTIITSPPYYGLRDYGVAGQMGLEETPEEYVAALVALLREARRVLKDDGTLWLNLGDSYAGSGMGGGNGTSSTLDSTHHAERTGTQSVSLRNDGLPAKNLIGIPWRVAFALQADGWYLRQEIIWSKPNPMPESVKDRCTKSHEQIFLLTKNARYYFDADAIKEPAKWERWGNQTEHKKHPGTAGHLAGKTKTELQALGGGKRNKRTVWTVTPKPFKGAHFATFPIDLIEPCVLAGCPVGGLVLDPFAGAGTTGLAANKHGRNFLGLELNPDYAEMARKRIAAG